MAVVFMLIKITRYKAVDVGSKSGLDVLSYDCKSDFFPSFHGLITLSHYLSVLACLKQPIAK